MPKQRDRGTTPELGLKQALRILLMFGSAGNTNTHMKNSVQKTSVPASHEECTQDFFYRDLCLALLQPSEIYAAQQYPEFEVKKNCSYYSKTS